MKPAMWVMVWVMGVGLAVFPAVRSPAATNTWDGNGDSNNSGLWGDINQWDGAVPGADDAAILPEVTGNGNDGVATRTVTNDASRNVRELLMTQSSGTYPNQITLDADLGVGRVYVTPDSDAGINACRINVNGRTLTVGLGDLKSRVGGGRGLPSCSGSGTIVKAGTNELGLSYNPGTSFNGTYRVDNGTLVGNYGRIQGIVVVNTGGTYRIIADGGENRPIAVSGFGFASNGAFWADTTMTRSAGITVSNDASIHVSAARTLTQQGSLGGTGRLYKVGTGKLVLAANNNAYTKDVLIEAGTVEVTGLLQNGPITVRSNAVLVAASYRVGTVTVEPGGVWSNTAAPEWIKGTNADGNDDGAWSEAAAWGTGVVPTNLAILGNVTGNGNSGTSTRTVSNTASIAATTLEMRQSTGGYANRLRLHAAAAFDTIVLNPDTDAARQACVVDLNGQTMTVGLNDARLANYPALAGGGTLVKVGTNDAQFTYSPGFTWNGQYRLEGGVTRLVYNRISGTRYRVRDGGTLRIDGTSYLNYGGNEVAVEGDGYGSLGALHVSGTVAGGSFTCPLVITNDATVRIDAARTLGLNGPLRGTGELRLTGGGTLDLDGTWTYRVDGTAANGIVAEAGTVDISGCTLVITNTSEAVPNEYVVVDYSSAGGFLLGGSFAGVVGLPSKWTLHYEGTGVHPDCVVLRNAIAGTVIMVK